jgi:HrpA-like RNA helicase
MALTTTTSKPWSQYQPWQDARKILKMIADHQIILVVATTGVGKTVIFPKLLSHYFHYKTPIIITIPRQKITFDAAVFASQLMDVPLYEYNPETGELLIDGSREKRNIPTGMYYVGYKHGDEKRMSNRSTKLLFATDSLIKAYIQRDNLLSRYGGIIIDEAHERSIHIDILIKLVCDIARIRPDFRIIIMSATVNKDVFKHYVTKIGMTNTFAVYESIAPTQYKINIRNISKPIPLTSLLDEMLTTITGLLMDRKSRRGDILAFVTSDGEAVKLSKMINANYDKFLPDWKPFACSLSSKTMQIDKTIATEKNGLTMASEENGMTYHVKVIVATNAAESSMTFKTFVVYVVDGGYVYEKLWDADNYVYSAGKNLITQANITQRCGRTGRTIEGDCIQMYSRLQYEKLDKYPSPAINREDFTSEFLSILTLEQIGGDLKKALAFCHDMIEPVANFRSNLIVAIRNLIDMDILVGLPSAAEATESLAKLSPIAKLAGKFGRFDIRSGRMVLAAALLGVPEPAIMLGALLNTITKPDDLFFMRRGADRKQKFLIDSIKKNWTHHTGDHLSLLNIFMSWLNSEDKMQFARMNMLNNRMMMNIQKSYVELYKLILDLDLSTLGIPGIAYTKKIVVPETRLSKQSSREVAARVGGDAIDPVGTSLDNQTGGGSSSSSSSSTDTAMPLQTGGRYAPISHHHNEPDANDEDTQFTLQYGGDSAADGAADGSDSATDGGDGGDSAADGGDSATDGSDSYKRTLSHKPKQYTKRQSKPRYPQRGERTYTKKRSKRKFETYNIEKYLSPTQIDNLLFAIGYGYNTNLGYYIATKGKYQIINNTNYLVGMSESVLADNKSPPPYVIYYKVEHQTAKNETNFQIVSEINRDVLTKIIQLQELRKTTNKFLNMRAITTFIDTKKTLTISNNKHSAT